MAFRSPSMLQQIKQWLGPIGYVLFILLTLSLLGSLLAILVAPITAIPIIGLVGLFFVPFPTFLMYLGGIFIVYMMFHVMPIGKWRGVTGLICGLTFVGAAAFGIPLMANREFDVWLAQFRQRGIWKPVSLSTGSNVTLVGSQHSATYFGCDSFCQGLLLSGQAKQVTFMTSPVFDRPEDLKITGDRYSLSENVDNCLAKLPQMEPDSPLYNGNFDGDEDRIRHQLNRDFQSGLFSKDFDDAVQSCFRVDKVSNQDLSGWVFVDWQTEFPPAGDDSHVPLLDARIAILNADDKKSDIIELFKIHGTRMSSPAWIWPYGGNAGSGGIFSPQFAREFVEWKGPERDFDQWWGYIEKRTEIAQAAIDRIKKAQSAGRTYGAPTD
ncbi:MAG: hypothetical protein HEQ34_14130 [Sphingorhabdus sp.]|uniref:hypothetical protein n=1 Tax=Sphingorhabdus sp. TaxID=1902408 RepID=UPI0025D5E800|nr:hypothetical protein [Sphingorhabdus sp.]MCO4093066.1 hypothetical protein [Sphingorhabdus sp.]